MFKQMLVTEWAPFGTLSEQQLNQLENHYAALTRWNTRLNLTRIHDPLDAVKFHYCESLFLGRYLPTSAHRIVDVGSGGGFPGIPVAILRPQCEITLIESHQRKAVFLREVSRELRNVRILSQRAEGIVDTFDWLISRAVAPAEVLKLNFSLNIALLIGEEDALRLQGHREPVPWGKQRVVFHVER